MLSNRSHRVSYSVLLSLSICHSSNTFSLFSSCSSEEEEFAASGADDGEEDEEDAGSDGGSWDKGARPKRGLRGVPKFKPRRTQRRGRKRRRRRSSEEEEETDVEMGECTNMTYFNYYFFLCLIIGPPIIVLSLLFVKL